jgi:hypothetical protein
LHIVQKKLERLGHLLAAKEEDDLIDKNSNKLQGEMIDSINQEIGKSCINLFEIFKK